MSIILANPWGLLGLLAVPAVLAIHFLQRRTRTIAVSTLFLIETQRDQARMGRRFERLISSVPLWLQLLVALLLTVCLAQPRVAAPGSVLRVAVVVDDSASMRVFKDDLARELAAYAGKNRGTAARIEWLVMPANPASPRLYAGDSTADMLAALAEWSPAGGVPDPRQALRLARERAGNQGAVLFATDTPRAGLPADAALMAVGHSFDNAGCYGASVGLKDGKAVWEALIVNRGAATTRTWHLEWDGEGRSPDATVSLPASGVAAIGGPLPDGASRLSVVMEGDRFTFDDRFPFLAPVPKPLVYRSLLPDSLQWLASRVAKSVPGMAAAGAGQDGDLAFAASKDGLFPMVRGPAILMSSAGDAMAKTLAGPVAAARNPLVEGLTWGALSVSDVAMVPPVSGDTVLLWAGQIPLVSLRPADGGTQQLVLHFNPSLSNWERLPAAAVLMLRYCEDVRRAKRGTAREQLEPGQDLAPLLPRDLHGAARVEVLDESGATAATRVALTAPNESGFMRVKEGDTVLLEGAVAFADAREGDFLVCATKLPEAGAAASSQAGDAFAPWWPLLILALLGAVLGAWGYAVRDARRARAEEIV